MPEIRATYAPRSSADGITYKHTHTCHQGPELAGGWDSDTLILNGGRGGPHTHTHTDTHTHTHTHTAPLCLAAVTGLSPSLPSQG